MANTNKSQNITALADGSTATTQSASDNSTKLATTAYADTAGAGVGTLQQVFDAGQSIIVANNDNQILQYTNNDTTNNPRNIVSINTGTGQNLLLDQDGNGIALDIDTEATSANTIRISATALAGADMITCTDANALTSGSMLKFQSNSADATARNLVDIFNQSGANSKAMAIRQETAADALFIDDNGNGNAIAIDADSNSASDIYAVSITADNAGAGNPGGIDMSSFAVDEPLIKAPADAITSAGTVSHQIAVDIGGTTYYLVAYTTGT